MQKVLNNFRKQNRPFMYLTIIVLFLKMGIDAELLNFNGLFDTVLTNEVSNKSYVDLNQ